MDTNVTVQTHGKKEIKLSLDTINKKNGGKKFVKYV